VIITLTPSQKATIGVSLMIKKIFWQKIGENFDAIKAASGETSSHFFAFPRLASFIQRNPRTENV
jgi:hypothetical protein